MKKNILLGCVADDFTGASDAASFIAKSGIPTVLFNGVPSDDTVPEGGAVVIALRSRSIAPEKAVAQSRQALRWLRSHGAQQLYIKYCSTFDSTPKGNIGPVCDDALEQLGLKSTLLCPSLPVNGRTVRSGSLYVDGVPLAETHMRNHPLNPMWASSIPELMEPQSKYPCLVLDDDLLAGPEARLRAAISAFSQAHDRFYLIPDYETDEQGQRITELFGGELLLTGGSALAGLLAERAMAMQSADPDRAMPAGVRGKALLLAGSCSAATRRQIKAYAAGGGKSIPIDPVRLRSGELDAGFVWALVQKEPGPVLVYTTEKSSDGPEAADAAVRLEAFMAQLARLAYDDGVVRIIVAGGETSGVVAQELGFDAFQIGTSVAPGVPVLTPVQKPEFRLILKSGNFGDDLFFEKALALTGWMGAD